jgi:hypothetical protein
MVYLIWLNKDIHIPLLGLVLMVYVEKTYAYIWKHL